MVNDAPPPRVLDCSHGSLSRFSCTGPEQGEARAVEATRQPPSISEKGKFLRIRVLAPAAFAACALFSAAFATFHAADAQPAPAPSAKPTVAPTASPSPSPTPFKLITLSGGADAGFTSISGTNVARFINGTPNRVFDGFAALSIPVANQFGAGKIGVEQLPTTLNTLDPQNLNLKMVLNGTFGATVEGSFGTDADVIASNGQSHTSGVNATQAFVSYANANGPFTLIVGKFETLAGAEVIESPADIEYSRSYLFGLAVPFTHTGARLTYVMNPKLSINVGANNGWDDWLFQGKKITAEGGLSITASPAVSVTLDTYNGNDCVNYVNVYSCVPPFYNRMLYDAVVIVKATPNLTLTGNYDNGTQLGASLVNSAGNFTKVGAAKWSGYAGYAQYQVSPKAYVALRGESFQDMGGFRTGFTQTLTEGTLTVGYSMIPNMTTRVEYRADSSNQPTFAFINTAGLGRTSQNSIGVEQLFKF
jgi:hypothetical protein